MSEENSVEEWFEEIARGLDYRFQYGQENKWATIEQMFYNGHTSNRSSGSNIIYSTGDAFLSTVHNSNPTIMIDPKREDQSLWAPCVEGMANDLVCETKLKRSMQRSCLNAYLWGAGVMKIGYDSEYGWDPKFDARGTQQPIGASLTRFTPKQTLNEYSDNRPGMPWVKPCLPHDIVVPWGTVDLDDCPWIAHRVVRHVDDIKSDVKYSSKQKLEPVMSMRDFVESYQTVNKPYRIGPDLMSQSMTEGTGEAEFVELWEIHDKRTHKIYVISTGYNKFLRQDINHLQLKGLPFVEVGFVQKSRTFWRTSDALYLMNHQAEITDITIQARKQRRINVLRWIAKQGAFDDAELNKVTGRDVGAVAIMKQSAGTISEAIQTAPLSNANQMLYQELEDVRSSARETVGFDRNSYGEYRGARTTATEVQAVQGSKDMRMGRKQDYVADAYVEVVEKMLKLCYKFWTTPKVVQTMGMDGAMIWQQYVPSEIAGDYSVKCIFDDPAQDSIQARQSEAIQLLQLAQTDPTIDPIAVRRNLARSSTNGRIAGVFKQGILSQTGASPAGAQASGVQQGTRATPTRQPAR